MKKQFNKKNVKSSIGEALVQGIKESLAEGKAIKITNDLQKVISRKIQESLEDELENYIEVEDEYEDDENFDDVLDGDEGEFHSTEDLFQDYTINLDELDDDDEIVITINKDGSAKIDRIETIEGEEYSADELESAGVIERVKKESTDTNGVAKKNPNDKKKVKMLSDEEGKRKYPKTVKSGKVEDKLYENDIKISGVDLTIDPESEAIVDEEGNVEFITDVENEDIIDAEDIDVNEELPSEDNDTEIKPEDEDLY